MKLPEPATVTVLQGISYYTESQLKQAMRDAYEDAAQICDRQAIPNAGFLTEKIRALIKEIDA